MFKHPVPVYVLAVLLSTSAASMAAAEPAERSNILMVIVDDLASMAPAKTRKPETPALDKLAARGYRFVNNFANVPVCGASRASMLSGLAPSGERFLTYNTRLDVDVPNVTSLPAFFKQQGWYTLANGKVFDVIEDSERSWSEPVWNPEQQWHSKQEVDGRGEHLQKAYIEAIEGARPPSSEKLDVEDDAYPDGQIAAKSIKDLARLAQSSSPFFMAVGFRKPHLPFNAPARYWSDNVQEIELPPSWYALTEALPALARHRSAELRLQYDALPLVGELDTSAAKQIIAGYYAATRYADRQVERVLQALEDNGLAESTIVLVCGDHGFLLGEQQMWTKHALFEPALRTPLIISAPAFAGGKQIEAVADLLDIYPTLVELAGLQAPGHLEGHSLVTLMQNPSLSSRVEKPASLSRWINGVSLRDEKHRYTRWYDKQNNTVEEMLFDIQSDPDELENIADNSESAAVLVGLRARIDEYNQGAQWSESLARNTRVWQLANSRLGTVFALGMVYPVYTLLGILLLLILFVAIIWKLFRIVRKK